MMKLSRLLVKLSLVLFSLAAFGQVTVYPWSLLKPQFFDANGKVLAGGCLNFYAAGTTNAQAIYTDSTGSVQQQNPIVLDAAGRIPFGTDVWITATAYDIWAYSSGGSQCASGTLQWQKLGVKPFAPLIGTLLASPTLTSPTSTGTDNGTETLQNKTLASPAFTGIETGVAVHSLAINSETVSASPRMAWTGDNPSNSLVLSGGFPFNIWTLDKAITVTRVQATLYTAAVGCSASPTIVITDGTTVAATLVILNGTNLYDSGPISVNYAAAASLQMKAGNGANSCTTVPQYNVTVQYKMQ